MFLGLVNTFTACNSSLDFAPAVSRYGANVANTTTASNHELDLTIGFGMATFVCQIMVANKLPAAVFAAVVGFSVAFFAVFLYAFAAASRTIEWYGYFYTLSYNSLS